MLEETQERAATEQEAAVVPNPIDSRLIAAIRRLVARQDLRDGDIVVGLQNGHRTWKIWDHISYLLSTKVLYRDQNGRLRNSG